MLDPSRLCLNLFRQYGVQEWLFDMSLVVSLSGTKRLIAGLLANKQAQRTVTLVSTMFQIQSGTASPIATLANDQV